MIAARYQVVGIDRSSSRRRRPQLERPDQVAHKRFVALGLVVALRHDNRWSQQHRIPLQQRVVVDVTAYLTRYPQEVAFGEEDAGTVFDRYHTPDFVMYNDGVQLDRERLLAHVQPARKRAKDIRVEVHEAISTADQVAARYTLTAEMATGNAIATEIYMFGRVAPDGRLARVDQITRDVSR